MLGICAGESDSIQACMWTLQQPAGTVSKPGGGGGKKGKKGKGQEGEQRFTILF